MNDWHVGIDINKPGALVFTPFNGRILKVRRPSKLLLVGMVYMLIKEYMKCES